MEQETSLIKVETFKEVIDKAPNALMLNQNSVENAVNFGKALLDTIEAEGMNDDIDQKCNEYLVKLKKTHIALDERRKPITQLFDHVKKVFTDLENQVNTKSNIYMSIQKHRDDYAALKLKEQQEKEAEAKRKLAVDQERISVRAVIEQGLSEYVYDYIDLKQNELLELFEGATLENFDTTEKAISEFPAYYPAEHYALYQPNVRIVYITYDDIVLIVNELASEKFEDFANEFKTSIEGLKNQYLDKLPSKKRELQEIQAAFYNGLCLVV